MSVTDTLRISLSFQNTDALEGFSPGFLILHSHHVKSLKIRCLDIYVNIFFRIFATFDLSGLGRNLTFLAL